MRGAQQGKHPEHVRQTVVQHSQQRDRRDDVLVTSCYRVVDASDPVDHIVAELVSDTLASNRC